MVSLYSTHMFIGGLTAGRADGDLGVENVFAVSRISTAEVTAGVFYA